MRSAALTLGVMAAMSSLGNDRHTSDAKRRGSRRHVAPRYDGEEMTHGPIEAS